jgi:hypothetical protein
MKKYLAVLATVATIALVVIAGALAASAATQVWEIQRKADSCAFLRDQVTRNPTEDELIAGCPGGFWGK